MREQIEKTANDICEENLKDLETLTEELDSFLQKLRALYHEENLAKALNDDNPLFQEILQSTDRLQFILEKLEDSNIPDLLDENDDLKPTKNQYLASILGFDEDLIQFLDKSDNYYSDEQLVLEFIEKKENEFQDEKFNSWEEAFRSLGFTPIKSKILGKLADENPYSTHETPGQWACRHVEQEFKYNILLSSLSYHNWNTTNAIDIGESKF